MARIKYYDASSASWKYADKAGSTTVTVDGITAIPAPDTASVGQTIVVTEVDSNGKPAVWEAVDFPSGGHNAFLYEFTLEEDLGVVNLAFPANWEKILQFNIHMEANIPTEMEVTSFTGGSGWAGIGTLPAGSIGLNIYGITFDLAGHNTTICTEVSIAHSSDSALPKFPTKGRLAYKTGNTFALYSATEGAMFPAGTTFYVWGVYAS